MTLLGTVCTAAPAAVFNLESATIDDIRAAFDARALSSVELTVRFLNRIDAFDRSGPTLNAFLALDPTQLAQAADSDQRRATGRSRGPLEGVPIAARGVIDIAGLPSTSGNAMFAQALPPGDADVIARLRAAGAVIQGHLNLSDFADANLTDGLPGSSLVGPCLSPYDRLREVGGSSGGSGAAAAASFTMIALGTETYGSMAGPATVNSVVAYRPTHEAVSRHGVFPNQPVTDIVGPLTRTVKDSAYAVAAMQGPSAQDYFTTVTPVRAGVDLVPSTGNAAALAGKRIGVFRQIMTNADGSFAGPALARPEFDAALLELQRLGATLVEVTDIPYDVANFEKDTRLQNDSLDASLGQAGHAGSLNAKRRYFDTLTEPKATFERFLDEWYQVWWFGGPFGWKETNGFESPEQRQRAIDRSFLAYESDPEVAAYLKAREEVRTIFRTYMTTHSLDALVYPLDGLPWPLEGDDTTGFYDEYSADNYLLSAKAFFSAYLGFSRVAVPWSYHQGLPAVSIDFVGLPGHDRQVLAISEAFESGTRRRIPPPLTPSLPGEAFAFHTPSGRVDDLAPPVLNVGSPAFSVQSIPAQQNRLVISGSVADESPLASTEVFVNGRQVLKTKGNTFNIAVARVRLQEWVNPETNELVVTVLARDVHNNASAARATFTLLR